MPIPTTTITVRISHQCLATLLEFYTAEGIAKASAAGLISMAVEDFAKTLISQNLAQQYDIEEAIELTAGLKFQQSRSRRLSSNLLGEINLHRVREMMAEKRRSTNTPQSQAIDQKELNKILDANSLNGIISPKDNERDD